MSIELPEAKILADQMDKALQGKRIKSYHLKDIERLQRVGMLDEDTTSFENLTNGKIQRVTSRGNVIRVKLDNGMNLILGPEYGGKILYHTTEKGA